MEEIGEERWTRSDIRTVREELGPFEDNEGKVTLHTKAININENIKKMKTILLLHKQSYSGLFSKRHYFPEEHD